MRLIAKKLTNCDLVPWPGVQIHGWGKFLWDRRGEKKICLRLKGVLCWIKALGMRSEESDKSNKKSVHEASSNP